MALRQTVMALAASLVMAAGAVQAHDPDGGQRGPGMMSGAGPGMMGGMGPGMMGGMQPGMMGGMGPGMMGGMGPGMMGGMGPGMMGGMGPGMMGGMGPGMMGGMGPGMMGGMGPGMMGGMGPGMMSGYGGMDEAVRADVTQLHREHARKQGDLIGELWEKRVDLSAALADPTADPAAVGEAFAAVADVERRLLENRIALRKSLHEVVGDRTGG